MRGVGGCEGGHIGRTQGWLTILESKFGPGNQIGSRHFSGPLQQILKVKDVI